MSAWFKRKEQSRIIFSQNLKALLKALCSHEHERSIALSGGLLISVLESSLPNLSSRKEHVLEHWTVWIVHVMAQNASSHYG